MTDLFMENNARECGIPKIYSIFARDIQADKNVCGFLITPPIVKKIGNNVIMEGRILARAWDECQKTGKLSLSFIDCSQGGFLTDFFLL